MSLALLSYMLDYAVREVLKVIDWSEINLEDRLYISFLLDLLLCFISGEHNIRVYIQTLPGAVVVSGERICM